MLPDTAEVQKKKIKASSIPLILDQTYYAGLDGLRAISILFVITAHLFFRKPIARIGELGVAIFFVISGFLITTLLLKEHARTGKINLKNFYIRRVLRIFPVAFLFLFVLIVLNAIFNLGITKLNFLTSFLYIKNLPIKNSVEWHTGHFWSLSVEEQFYLMFPILLVINKKLTKLVSVIAILLVPGICYLGYNNVGILYSNKLIHHVAFLIIFLLGRGTVSILIGCVLSILTFDGAFKRLPRNKWLSLILFLVAPIFPVMGSPFFIPFYGLCVFSLIIAFIILLNIDSDNYFVRFLNKKFMVKMGVLSYSIYVWQQIFTHDQPWANTFPYGGSPYLNIPALLVVSYLSYYLYERKFLLLKKRFSSTLK